MRIILQIVSWLALAGTILPSILYYTGQLDMSQLNKAMLIATILWFVATSMWMGREKSAADEPGSSYVP